MTCRKKIPERYTLASIGFLGGITSFLLYTNMSVAIVDMIDFSAEYNNSVNTSIAQNSSSDRCPDMGAATFNHDSGSSHVTFNWTGGEQGLILGSFSYGKLAAVILITCIGQRFGRVRVITINFLVASIVTILSPVAAIYGGYSALIVARVIVGMTMGSTMPLFLGLVGVWSPPQEISKILSFVLAGPPVGISLAFPISGAIAGSLGWPAVFYITGGWGVLYTIIVYFVIYDSPETHPRIKPKEKAYIQDKTKILSNINSHRKLPAVPWLKILKSWPVICVVSVNACSVFGRNLMSTMLPRYLRTDLQVDIRTSGLISAIPFAAYGLLLFGTGPAADFIIAKGFKTIHVRKIFSVIGLIIPAITITSAGFINCNIGISMLLFTITGAMEAFVVPGVKACIVELSPEHSGIIASIATTAASIPGILAPQLAGSLQDAYREHPEIGWRIAFGVTGAFNALAAVIFAIFGTNKKQSWSNQKKYSVVTIAETVE